MRRHIDSSFRVRLHANRPVCQGVGDEDHELYGDDDLSRPKHAEQQSTSPERLAVSRANQVHARIV